MNLDLFDEADPSPPAANPSARDPWCCAATPCRRRRPAAIPGRSDPAVAVPTHGNPGGHLMSVALSNCGRLGWTTDHDGYRYTPADPLSGGPGRHAAGLRRPGTRGRRRAGFAGFEPDACLLNRYEPGARMSCTRTATSAISARPSCRCRWACRRCFFSVAWRARTPPPACRCSTATWWSGWRGPPAFPRRAAAEGQAASAPGQPASEPHAAQGGLRRRARSGPPDQGGRNRLA